MTHPDFVILYVDNTFASTSFYRDLLATEPVENSPTFSLFVLSTGMKLGLWSRHTALPTVTGQSGGMEIGFRVDAVVEVDRIYADWTKRGLRVLQTPTQAGFGYTFTVADPDGHRLRVYARTDVA